MTDTSTANRPADLIDRAAGLVAGSATHTLRHQRDKVVATAQLSHDAMLDPSLTDLSLSHRLLVALYACRLTPSPALAGHYRDRALDAGADPVLVSLADTGAAPQAFADPSLRAMMTFARILTERPTEGDKAALMQLPAAGLSTPSTVLLAQLIAFISYQTRLVSGLKALKAAQEDGTLAVSPIADAAPAADKVGILANEHLSVGALIEAHGFTNAMLKWRAWLDVVRIDQATPEQLAALDAAHQTAKTSDYYLLLAHQPSILHTRSTAFNAVMYAPRGLPRAERELGAMAASRINGCVYCCSVHSRFFEQLAKRNDVVAQLFEDPHTAGASARDRAIIRFSTALTLQPGELSAQHLRPLREAGLTDLEILDLVHSVAMFGWANRLMANLGEPYLAEAA
ncbi:peroxidase-related enzyme [Hydrogenophaga sp.]|uniref:CMD domain-containing protein n=1 Tax=Hydrogenophaga sp. TaxID=1904254 RepID=UPI002602E786|nr:peroxidase-related enzyme [Hydrogenophaga sp.]MCW5655131.1 peroxidase-related enzyme [Hydrogenophaga sp.]